MLDRFCAIEDRRRLVINVVAESLDRAPQAGGVVIVFVHMKPVNALLPVKPHAYESLDLV